MASARRRAFSALLVLIAIVVLIVLLEALLQYLPRDIAELYATHRRVLYAILAIIAGAIIIQLLASAALLRLKGLREAYLIRNVILLLGYTILALIVATILGVSGESILASATFSGLVLGLALQPVLSNFFAGLLILLSGFIRPGQDVRIAGGLPVFLLSFPAYKFFSRDYMIPSIKGRVLEIGFLYTKILDTDGQVVKVSNMTLLSSSVVLEEAEESKVIQVRYEFPVMCNPDDVLPELQKSLHGLLESDYNLYIEEQSDKQYYIVLLRTLAPPHEKTRELRSAIMREFIKTHRKLLAEKKC
jgi:small conductance mechanosensitive channel